MAQVHRFTLPWAIAAGHDVYIQGLGLFTSGTLDVDLSKTTLISNLQAAPGITDAGVVDNAVTPAPGSAGNNDPYPQYLTLDDLTSALASMPGIGALVDINTMNTAIASSVFYAPIDLSWSGSAWPTRPNTSGTSRPVYWWGPATASLPTNGTTAGGTAAAAPGDRIFLS